MAPPALRAGGAIRGVRGGGSPPGACRKVLQTLGGLRERCSKLLWRLLYPYSYTLPTLPNGSFL
eukprot:8668316-Alexandrium_andersonii.AAC.1